MKLFTRSDRRCCGNLREIWGSNKEVKPKILRSRHGIARQSTCSFPREYADHCPKKLLRNITCLTDDEPQKFGLGMKEIWEIDPAKHKEGTVTHTMGWPLKTIKVTDLDIM